MRARLCLFGEQSLTPGPDPHTAPVDLYSPQLRWLLAYLALHPSQALDRRKLAFLLWPDTTEANALRHLRQHLHRLRQVLAALDLPPDMVSSRSGQLYFQPGPHLWIDVVQFGQQIGDRHRQIEAIELYRGDLLPGCELELLQPIRARLKESYQEALRTQVAIAHMQRNYPRARHYAARLLESDPMCESSHRIYMETLYFSGERVLALQHFSRLQTLLRTSLKTEPMAQTVTLYEQIQSGALPGDIPALISSTEQAAQALRTLARISEAFIGRRAELAGLDEALGQAFNGRGSFILIEGDSGLGKTSLLRTWQQARAEKMLVFPGQGRTGAVGMPAAAVLEALRQAHSQINRSWFPPQSPWPGELRALLELVEASAAPAEAARQPLVNRLGQFILAFAAHAPRPVALLIDDLHQADDVTWQLLAFLARRAVTASFLLIGTCQPGQLSATAQHLGRSLLRHGHLQTMELSPLTLAETTRLAALLLGQGRKPDPAFAGYLYRVTEGNPFFITEFIKTSQKLSSLSAGGPPRTVQSVVKARLDSLSPADRDLLAVAAVIGRTFNFRVLAEAVPTVQYHQVLEALESWLEKGLVTETGEGYEFTHEQIHQAAYAGLDPARCRRLHQEIARLLLTLPLEPRLRDPMRVAYHYLHSDRPEQALPDLVTGGKRALALASRPEAETLARQCLSLLAGDCFEEVEETLAVGDLEQAYTLLDEQVEIWLHKNHPDDEDTL